MDMIIALLVGLLLQSPLQFEVASIKVNKSGLGYGNMDFPPNGRVNIVNVTFKMMMQASYRLQDYQIIGGPNWVNTDRFDVQATTSADYKPAPLAPRPAAPCFGSGCPMTPAQVMMQDLLRHRFELKTHREIRELQVFELRIGRNGFKLREVDPRKPIVASPPPPPGTPPPTNIASVLTPPPGAIGIFATALAGSSVPISALASSLSGILGRPVIDKTG